MKKKNLAWWKKIRKFKAKEFNARGRPGSGRLNMQKKAVRTFDWIRRIAGIPMHVTSGYRTPERNKKIGGKSRSAHVKGWGADFRARSSRARFLILEAAFKMKVKRIGLSKKPGFIHLDMDPSLPQKVFWPY